jgi:hypothetical protein
LQRVPEAASLCQSLVLPLRERLGIPALQRSIKRALVTMNHFDELLDDEQVRQDDEEGEEEDHDRDDAYVPIVTPSVADEADIKPLPVTSNY